MMATSTVPIGNAAGLNQANPALSSAPKAVGVPTNPAPIAGGAMPSSTNPYLFGGGAPGSSAPAPGTAPVGTAPMIGSPTITGGTPLNSDQQQQKNLSDQWADIAGATGTAEYNFMQGMSGTESQIYQNWLQSMQPQYATAQANLGQSMGAAGVSPNSTIATQAEASLQANELAQQGGVEAQLMQTNQQDQMAMLQNMQAPAIQQVADSSGWNLFSNILGGIGSVASLIPGVGGAIGAGMKGIGSLFSGGGGGGSTVPTNTGSYTPPGQTTVWT